MAGRVRGDEGSATVELAVTMPVLALLLVTLVQLGVWFHARQVALGAARHAVEATRREGGSAGSGYAAADDWLAEVGDDTLRNRSVAISDGSDVTVTVSGEALHVVPGPWRVSVSVSGPREEPTP